MRWLKENWKKLLGWIGISFAVMYIFFNMIWEMLFDKDKKKLEERIKKIKEEDKKTNKELNNFDTLYKIHQDAVEQFNKQYEEVKNEKIKQENIGFDDAVRIIDDTIKHSDSNNYKG